MNRAELKAEREFPEGESEARQKKFPWLLQTAIFIHFCSFFRFLLTQKTRDLIWK